MQFDTLTHTSEREKQKHHTRQHTSLTRIRLAPRLFFFFSPFSAMIIFGKMIMSSRAPLNPKGAMLLYNVYQSLINGFMAFWLCYQAYAAGFSVWGNYEDHTAKGFPIAFGMWMHYNNKYLELFDTFFMIVKKKDEQISFLHVYHHILLVWSWFLCLLFCIGGDAYFGASFNSLVHLFMYSYYAMALFSIPCPWKKHLTIFQMVQFVFCASQSIYVFFKGNVWWFVPALQLFVMINMLYLFSQFYSKKYSKDGAAGKKGTKAVAPAAATTSTTADFAFDSSAERGAGASSPAPSFSTALVGNNEAEAQVAAAAEEEEVVAKKPASTKKRSKKAE